MMLRAIAIIPFLFAQCIFLSGNSLVESFLVTDIRSTCRRCLGSIPSTLHLSTSSSSSAAAAAAKNAILDTSMYDDKLQEILQWLNGLNQIHRSEPFWISNCDDITTLSPSKLVQQHLDQLMASTTTATTAATTTTTIGTQTPKSPVVLFNNPQDQARFDAQWHHCLQTMLPDHELVSILQTGMSNTHPLRLQLIACPKDTSFSLHVHPAVELDIPIVGNLYERRACGGSGGGGDGDGVLLLLDRTTLQRHDVASAQPTPQELQRVSQELSQHVVFEDCGPQGIFTDRRIPQGQALVNLVGSVHQSYTSTEGCLLLVLGPNVHAHFVPGNFRQRQGIEQLEGIDELLLL